MEDSGPLTLSELGPATGALSSTGGAPRLEEISHEIKTTSSARKNRQKRRMKGQTDIDPTSSLQMTDSIIKPEKSYIDALSARLDPPLPPIQAPLSPLTHSQAPLPPIQVLVNKEKDENDTTQKEKRTQKKRKRKSIDTTLLETTPLPDPIPVTPPSIENIPSTQDPQEPPTVQTPPAPLVQKPSSIQIPSVQEPTSLQEPLSVQTSPLRHVQEPIEVSDDNSHQLQGETTPSPLTLQGPLQGIQRPANDPLLLVDNEDIREGNIPPLIKPSSHDKLSTDNKGHTTFQQQPDTRLFVRTHLKHHHHDHHGNHDHHHHHGNHEPHHGHHDHHHHGHHHQGHHHQGHHHQGHHHHGHHHHGHHSSTKLFTPSETVMESVSAMSGGEGEGEEERVLSNGEFVLMIHHFIKIFIMATHGIAAGISLWDTVVCYTLTAHYNHSLLLLYYHHFPLGLHALYMLVTSAVIVILLDRFDVAKISIHCLKSCCQLKDLALGTALVLLVLALIVISTDAFLDSRIALYTKEPSLWTDLLSPTNSTTITTSVLFTTVTGIRYTATNSSPVSGYVTGWLALSAVRSISLTISWIIINLTVYYNRHDRIEEYVKELDKQQPAHHHHHTSHHNEYHLK